MDMVEGWRYTVDIGSFRSYTRYYLWYGHMVTYRYSAIGGIYKLSYITPSACSGVVF